MGTRKSRTIAEKEDFAKKAIQMQKHKMKMSEICGILDVNISTINKWMIAFRAGEYKMSEKDKKKRCLVTKKTEQVQSESVLMDVRLVNIEKKLDDMLIKIDFIYEALT